MSSATAVQPSREYEKIAVLLGTPFYQYDMAVIRAQIQRIRGSFRFPISLLYATMANDECEILKAIAQSGVGACVNSIKHLQLAMQFGFQKDIVQFTSTGIPREDMDILGQFGIPVNLDSVGQVGQWCRMGKDSRFGVRVNAGSLLETSLTRDRIGVDESGLQAAEREADRWGGILAGLHIYCGTNVKTPGAIIPVLGAFFARAARIQTLEYVNIGGGIGIDYEGRGNEFDYEAFGESVSALAEQLCDALGRRINVFFEPGRCMVAAAGVFVTRITDVKDLGGRTFVTVDGSVAVFPRPLHHPDSPHRVRMISDHFGARKPVTIVGRTTFSRDILAECELPDVKVGDLIAFENAGAYCCSMQSRFLGQKVPLSYFGKP